MNNIEIALEETMYEMIFPIFQNNYKIRRSFDPENEEDDTQLFSRQYS